MAALCAILAIAITLVAQNPPPKGTPQGGSSQAATAYQQNNPSPASEAKNGEYGDNQPGGKTSKAEDKNKGKTDWWARVFSGYTALFTGVLSLVGTAGVFVAVGTLRKLREQTTANVIAANAAKSSADDLIASERAWVLVDSGVVPDDFTPDPNMVEILWVTPPMTNFGRTVGTIEAFAINFQSVAKGYKLPPEPSYTGIQRVNIPLPPKVPIQPMRVGIPLSTFIPARKMETTLYVYGLIQYSDFTSRKRETRFGMVYKVPSGYEPLKRGWYLCWDMPEPYLRCS